MGNGEIEDVVGVPITLDPKQFHDKKLEKIKIREDERVLQYERMRQVAMKNKANFVTCDDIKSEEDQHIMNGNIKHNEDENIQSKSENSAQLDIENKDESEIIPDDEIDSSNK